MKNLKVFIATMFILVSMLFASNVNSQVLMFDSTAGDVELTTPFVFDRGDINAGDTLFIANLYQHPAYFLVIWTIDSITDGGITILQKYNNTYYNPQSNDILLLDDPNSNLYPDSNFTNITGSIHLDTNNHTFYNKRLHIAWNTSICQESPNRHTPTTKFNLNVSQFNRIKFDLKFTDISASIWSNNYETKTYKAYPNPCENVLNVDVDGLKQLYTLTGQLLIETYDNKIDMYDFAPGMYILNVEGNTKKIIKK